MTTVGTGKYVYEAMENWAKLPEGWILGQTAIVTDSQDRVYLFNRSDHPLIVLDREGNYLASWGEGVLTDAHGMFIDAQDNLYMPVKNNHVVLKYSKNGDLLMTLGARDQPSDTGWSGNYSDPAVRAAGPFNRPSDVALDPKGDLYISDGYGNSRVHKFSAAGELLFSWAHPARLLRGSSTFPMVYGCIPTAGCLRPTGKITGYRFSRQTVCSWTSGPTLLGPVTSTSTPPRPCMWSSWMPSSASLPSRESCWPGGTNPTPPDMGKGPTPFG